MNSASDPFHPGERLMQERIGVRERMARRGAAAIRDYMPDQHREFFATLPFVVIAALDEQDWPIPTVLNGPFGFIATPDARTLHIGARPADDDPAAAGLFAGAPVGMLGIDPARRRRNRVNGSIVAKGSSGFTLSVVQSFGNCAQYIESRELHSTPAMPAPAETLDHLDAAAVIAITQADTFFVASASGPRDRPGLCVDVSHRGGPPGFVRVDGNVLTIPDFAGNRFYNTLGNLLLYPRVGLLFADFATGDVLQVSGETEIIWDIPEEERPAGAELLWRVQVGRVWRRRNVLPLRVQDKDPTLTVSNSAR
ncbi:MAG: pyridoxamine 5'-phosphate oxidase family protein [Acetobacteraceae bacterium]|nr:pyridoxamine 5'-phosphate oxidase family protein [Acetobacteraceae bacterium]